VLISASKVGITTRKGLINGRDQAHQD